MLSLECEIMERFIKCVIIESFIKYVIIECVISRAVDMFTSPLVTTHTDG